ncbi:MAG: hypothetical protein U9N54_10615 [candidate division Zixibacteria bacterium]|nr:hypothetical protein [candidate division Zixibacteria bacterium]
MVKQEIVKMKKRVKVLQKMLTELGPFMRGSVVLIGTRNKQYYFSLNKDKKTHIIYLGKKRVDTAIQYSDNYKKLLEIIEEMTILNMKLLKEDASLVP